MLGRCFANAANFIEGAVCGGRKACGAAYAFSLLLKQHVLSIWVGAECAVLPAWSWHRRVLAALCFTVLYTSGQLQH
jgi:hypothetical protein